MSYQPDRNKLTARPDEGGPAPLLLDSADLCRVLRIGRTTLHRLRAAGKLPRPLTLGGQLRWDAAEVTAWVAAGMPDAAAWEATKRAGE